MRPSLLIIIMDFLVSSLLLFVSGPGTRDEGVASRAAARGPTAAETAPEFAPAAILDMEQQWAREYQQQLAETKISSQAEALSLMESRGRDLSAARAQLEGQLAQQGAELARKQQNLAQLADTLGELRGERARQDEALQATRQQAAALTAEKSAVAATRDALAAAKAETERKLQEAEARRQELAAQALLLRQRIAEQADLIHRQTLTLASQQQAIRDDLAEADVRARMAAQASDATRRARATQIIENDGSLDELRTRAAELAVLITGR